MAASTDLFYDRCSEAYKWAWVWDDIYYYSGYSYGMQAPPHPLPPCSYPVARAPNLPQPSLPDSPLRADAALACAWPFLCGSAFNCPVDAPPTPTHVFVRLASSFLRAIHTIFISPLCPRGPHSPRTRRAGVRAAPLGRPSPSRCCAPTRSCSAACSSLWCAASAGAIAFGSASSFRRRRVPAVRDCAGRTETPTTAHASHTHGVCKAASHVSQRP